jgi:hypothetical protein
VSSSCSTGQHHSRPKGERAIHPAGERRD